MTLPCTLLLHNRKGQLANKRAKCERNPNSLFFLLELKVLDQPLLPLDAVLPISHYLCSCTAASCCDGLLELFELRAVMIQVEKVRESNVLQEVSASCL